MTSFKNDFGMLYKHPFWYLALHHRSIPNRQLVSYSKTKIVIGSRSTVARDDVMPRSTGFEIKRDVDPSGYLMYPWT